MVKTVNFSSHDHNTIGVRSRAVIASNRYEGTANVFRLFSKTVNKYLFYAKEAITTIELINSFQSAPVAAHLRECGISVRKMGTCDVRWLNIITGLGKKIPKTMKRAIIQESMFQLLDK